MKISSMRVLLTGATGGIGREVAQRLLQDGAEVMLVGRDATALAALSQSMAFAGDRVHAVTADLTRGADRAALCDAARRWHGGINVLVNNAGVNPFSLYQELRAAEMEAMLAVNLHAPMHLCRDLLPWLQTREAAVILNVGSVLGSIGYPGQVAYSASKFALRGFTEALRRELAHGPVRVKYFAPRSTRTAMNPAAVEAMNDRLGVTMDSAARVARELVSMLASRRHFAVVGWPEKLFVKINALLPGFVDRAVRGQLTVIRKAAQPCATQTEILSP
jgi:short-subunit dehydrogenase